MSDVDRIDQRLAAVERVVVDGEQELPELAELATIAEDVERLESRLAEHETRIADLEARTQTLSGFVGKVESVNESVEREAATAVASVDRLERRLDAIEGELENSIDANGDHDGSGAGVPTGEGSGPATPVEGTGAVDEAVGQSAVASATDGETVNGFQFGPGTESDDDPETVVSALLDDTDGETERRSPGAGRGEAAAASRDGTATDGGSPSADRRPATQEAVTRRLGSDHETAGRGPATDGSDESAEDEAQDDEGESLLSTIRSTLP